MLQGHHKNTDRLLKIPTATYIHQSTDVYVDVYRCVDINLQTHVQIIETYPPQNETPPKMNPPANQQKTQKIDPLKPKISSP